MRTPMANRSRFDHAIETLLQILERVPDGRKVGLRVYGHRLTAIEPKAAEDSELVFPPTALDATNRAELVTTLRNLRPRGKTPLVLSLKNAKSDVRSFGRGKVAVIVLTDGGDDTPMRKDGVKMARQLGDQKNVRLCMIGFAVTRADHEQQLRAMATSTNGRGVGDEYWPAIDAPGLRLAIEAHTIPKPSRWTLMDEGGSRVAEGEFGDDAKLPPGNYTLAMTLAGQRLVQPLTVKPEATTRISFNAAQLREFLQGNAYEPQPGTSASEPELAPDTDPDPQAKPSFCTNCGTKLPKGAGFCAECGTKVGG